MSGIDRLAALRNQRQQQNGQTHEMSNLNGIGGGAYTPAPAPPPPPAAGPPPSAGGDMSRSDFLSEITSIQDLISQYNSNVQEIAASNSRSLGAIDGGDAKTGATERLQDETRQLSDDIKARIRALTDGDMSSLGPQELQTRKNQVTLVRSKFMEALQNYQRVEQDFRSKSAQRVERQYRIVKPDATPEEVKEVVAGGQTQIFANATSRYADSRSAYREVQQRQQDLKKMEETLAELAQMFTDMGYIVEQQQEIFEALEKTTAEVEDNTEKGLVETGKAVISAARYRKGRKICFFVSLILIIVIVLAVALGICLNTDACKSNNNNNNSTA